MRVLLLGGGWSGEREVSLSGAVGIENALKNLGHEVRVLDPYLEFSDFLPQALASDFVFFNLHGYPGEDGVFQAMLDAVGRPYQGSGPAGSVLALNKAVTKTLFGNAGIPTARFEFLPVRPERDYVPRLQFPLFAKPNRGGSSIGAGVIRSVGDLFPAIDRIFELCDEVVLEEYLPGYEVTVSVLGDEALPPILIMPTDSAEFFDYKSKYTPNAAREICPAPISPELTREVKELALKAHNTLNLSDYSRTDFIVVEERPYVLEVNTLPGMTATSLLPQAARAVGYSFEQLIRKLIDLGMSKTRNDSGA